MHTNRALHRLAGGRLPEKAPVAILKITHQPLSHDAVHKSVFLLPQNGLWLRLTVKSRIWIALLRSHGKDSANHFVISRHRFLLPDQRGVESNHLFETPKELHVGLLEHGQVCELLLALLQLHLQLQAPCVQV